MLILTNIVGIIHSVFTITFNLVFYVLLTELCGQSVVIKSSVVESKMA